MSQTGPHDEFLELCAVSTSGELTEEEQKRLEEHLAVCPSCREALRQYQSVVDQAIPAFAATEEPEKVEQDHSWSQDRAEKALLDRIAREEKTPPNRTGNRNTSFDFAHRILPTPSESTWRHVWMLYAAGVLLFVSLSFFAYRIGIRRGADTAKAFPAQPSTPVPVQPSLEEQLSDAGHEHEVARAEIAHRDRMIADLRHQLDRQAAEITEMKAAQDRLQNDLRAGDASRQDLVQQRTELAQKLDSAQTNSQALQD